MLVNFLFAIYSTKTGLPLRNKYLQTIIVQFLSNMILDATYSSPFWLHKNDWYHLVQKHFYPFLAIIKV